MLHRSSVLKQTDQELRDLEAVLISEDDDADGMVIKQEKFEELKEELEYKFEEDKEYHLDKQKEKFQKNIR